MLSMSMIGNHFWCVVLAVCVLGGCAPGGRSAMADAKKETRPPVVAGAFYPGSPDRLRETVQSLLDRVPDIKPEGEIFAALAPHAGYVYSGPVAAYTHKLLQAAEFDTIVIIGHDAYRSAVAFVSPADFFETPLGQVPVDREMVTKMMAFDPGIREDRLLHSREHTVEVQLPFLQVMGRECRIVPILFGEPTFENCRILADAIRSAAGDRKVLVFGSTDMCHYPTYEVARRIDTATLEVLGSLDVRKLFAHLREQEHKGLALNVETALCAKGGVGTAILFAKDRGADHAQVLHYANSGDVPIGDKRRVVGYSAALLVRKR